MARYDTADFLASKTSGSFQVLHNKSENPIGKYEALFEQVLDNLELSDPLDLAFVLIQVFYSSHFLLANSVSPKIEKLMIFLQLCYFFIVPMVYTAIYK